MMEFLQETFSQNFVRASGHRGQEHKIKFKVKKSRLRLKHYGQVRKGKANIINFG